MGRGVRTRLGAATLLIVAVAGCTGDSNGPDDTTGGQEGVLHASDLDGDAWNTTDEGGGTLCGGLSGMVRSISSVAEGSETTLERDGVSVVSQAWIAREGSGSRQHDFDRLRGQAELCGPVDDVGDFGISEFDIVEDDPDRFVVQERRTINGVAGGADQLYFREGDVVGLVAVTYDGDEAPLPVTDLETAARSRAAELAEINA